MADHTLFISDLDGTLLNKKGFVSEFTVETLNGLISEGLRFTVATGRNLATTSRLMRNIPLKFPVILLNGAVEWNPNTQRFSYTGCFKDSTVKELRKAAEKIGIQGIWFFVVNGRLQLYHGTGLTGMEIEFFEHGFEEIAQIQQEGAFPKQPVLYAMFISDRKESLQKLREEVEGIAGIQSDLFPDLQNGSIWCLDIFSCSCDKGKAAEKLRVQTGSTCLVGFGDACNDHALFNVCDVKCAMGNAQLSLKSRADYILDDHDKDGVAKFLKQFWKKL